MQAMFWRGRLAVFGGGASVEGKKLGWLFAMDALDRKLQYY
jgi:hypothetical protein